MAEPREPQDRKPARRRPIKTTPPPVQAEAEGDGTIETTMPTPDGHLTLMVSDPGEWRRDVYEALKLNDMWTFAELVLDDDDLAAFQDADPTFRQCMEWAQSFEGAVQDGLGNSRRSSRSSRRARMR